MRWDLAVNEGVCRRALAACSALCISAESGESKQEVSAAQSQALPSLSHPTLVNHCSHCSAELLVLLWGRQCQAELSQHTALGLSALASTAWRGKAEGAVLCLPSGSAVGPGKGV